MLMLYKQPYGRIWWKQMINCTVRFAVTGLDKMPCTNTTRWSVLIPPTMPSDGTPVLTGSVMLSTSTVSSVDWHPLAAKTEVSARDTITPRSSVAPDVPTGSDETPCLLEDIDKFLMMIFIYQEKLYFLNIALYKSYMSNCMFPWQNAPFCVSLNPKFCNH